MIPQLIYLAILFIGVGNSIAKHGKEETKKVNAKYAIVANFIILSLLYFGGFFDTLLDSL